MARPANTSSGDKPERGADLLAREIERVRGMVHAHASSPATYRAMDLLRNWQAERLARTYADLISSERYRPATEFFLSDIYGAKDFTERDQSVVRAYPIMVRTLPDSALHTIAVAVEVHVLTAELDRQMWQVLTEKLGVTERFTESQYVEAFRRCDNRTARDRQLRLVRRVGEDLARIVAKPGIYQLLKLARKPARLAGFGELQDFLERGFAAFRHMGSGAEFLQTIARRETAIMDRIFAHHPNPLDLDAG